MESLVINPSDDLELKLLVISIYSEGIEIERICLLPAQVELRTGILERIPKGYSVSVVPVFGVRLPLPEGKVIDAYNRSF